MPDSWAKAFLPTTALLYWTVLPVSRETLRERGVARALADAVDADLDLAHAGAHRGQRVRRGQAQVVVAVRGEDVVAGDLFADAPDHVREAPRHGVADRVRDVQRGGAGVHRHLDDLEQELHRRPGGVLRAELDVVAQLAGAGHRGLGRLQHLVGAHAQHVLHVAGAGRQEHVDARALCVLDRLEAALDVAEAGARQPGDGRPLDGPGDLAHRLEVALAGHGKAGLDDVDAQARELLGDLQLGLGVQVDARRLLAVPQGR